jgi:hypothetical protein
VLSPFLNGRFPGISGLIEITEIEIDLIDSDLHETRMAIEKDGSLGSSASFRYRSAP